jgi:hypothetical protein
MVIGKKGIMTRTLFVIILALVVLVVLIWGFSTNWSGGLSNLDLFVGSTNIEFIESECELACKVDRNYTQVCEKERTLKLGGGNAVKGTCSSIGDVDTIKGYAGMPGCGFVDCREGEEAKCYEKGKRVDCETWLSLEEKARIDAEEARRRAEEAAEAAVNKRISDSIKRLESYIQSGGCEQIEQSLLPYSYGGGAEEFKSRVGVDSKDVKVYECEKTKGKIDDFDYDFKNCVFDLGEGEAYRIRFVDDPWARDTSAYYFMEGRFLSEDERIADRRANRFGTAAEQICNSI